MVSIVMPAYNAAKTIRESIESILAQTVDAWELIVIDDGSKDGTPQILAEFAALDGRIIFLQNERNSGASYTRNRAIALARGEWIAFLDSDDLWKPEKLEKQLALVAEHPDMVICYTASAFINDDGKPYDYVMPAIDRLTYKQLLRKNLMSCSSVMIRASVMKGIKMPNDKMHEDYYVWLNVLRTYGVAYGINEPLLVYRLCENSKSSNRIKSAKMLFNSYRAVGYNFVTSGFFVFQYTFHSIFKRIKIYTRR
jgi:teichuronic acid biosynthesis glycosyltransferase TuaG